MNLTPEQEQTIERYLDLLELGNERMNLTAVRSREEMIARHVNDSLSALPYLPDGSSVLDAGCGAGLPSLILKIVNPSLRFLLVDSVRKKVDFVNETIRALGLSDIRAVHTRIEDLEERSFDRVVARAVAPLPTLLEYALPFLKLGGVLVAYKGDAVEEEIAASAAALRTLGGRVAELVEVPADGMRHTLVLVEKTAKTPANYPRPRNLPRLKPL